MVTAVGCKEGQGLCPFFTELNCISIARIRVTANCLAWMERHDMSCPRRSADGMGIATDLSTTVVKVAVLGWVMDHINEPADRSSSSPRVRGTQVDLDPLTGCPRFIPAGAGNACFTLDPQLTDFGSSPRVRGTRLDDLFEQAVYRFIPAGAGNAWATIRRAACTTVHPRVCGERPDADRAARVPDGSSPRVRGTPAQSVTDFGAQRFIPACAGNALLPCQLRSDPPVHPRVCGERLRPIQLFLTVSGSSPRVRGTRPCECA
jgi:hypothetical protein